MQITVTIGPVPTSSALAWIGAANETLAVLREHDDVAVPWDVLAAFERFVAEWTDHAERHPETFVWSGLVEDSEVRTIGLHWARIVSVTRSGRVPSLSAAPPEAAAFYDELALAIAAAMASGGDAPIAAAFTDAVPAFDREHAPVRGEPSRVIVVDDDENIRMLLRIWLDGDPAFDVAGEAGDGHAAVELARVLQPHVAVLDVEMPGMTGIQALPMIQRVAPSCAVVMFSASDKRGEALAAGATTFLSKDAPMRGVVEAVRAAAQAAQTRRA